MLRVVVARMLPMLVTGSLMVGVASPAVVASAAPADMVNCPTICHIRQDVLEDIHHGEIAGAMADLHRLDHMARQQFLQDAHSRSQPSDMHHDFQIMVKVTDRINDSRANR